MVRALDAAAKRIAELNHTLSAHDVSDALAAFGQELWATRARDMPEARAKELFGDAGRRWQESLLPALEYEGVVIRQPDPARRTMVSLVYDLLAGHVVATSLLRTHGPGIVQLMAAPATSALFIGDYPDRHPLATDIFDALAGVMPRAGGKQLWQVVEHQLRGAALRRAISLEAEYLDQATVTALADNVDKLQGRDDIFTRLYAIHAAPRHPLNAQFVDRILRDRSVAERDLRWSEWLRPNARRLLADTAALTARWREHPECSEGDRLRARCLMWTLTSTDRSLRDAATAALYWYGRHDTEGLFSLTAEALTVNDAYMGERMAAAAYGVTTTRQLHDPAFEEPLASYLQTLLSLLTGPAASAPTFHALTRYYVSGTFAFARRYYPAAVPPDAAVSLSFSAGPVIVALRKGDARREHAEQTLGMDFHNYTLGRLFPDRDNYDDTHPGHREATDHLLGVVHALGWRADTFGDVDARIRDSSRFERDGRTVERYGKKYGWIGLHTVAGMLAASGQPLPEPEVDIDPTFPQVPRQVPILLDAWAKEAPADDYEWLRHGIVRPPDEFLTPSKLDDDEGPWVLVHAEMDNKDLATGRDVFGLFNTVLVDPSELDELLSWTRTVAHPGRDMIDLPSAYYLFAGEIPWHTRFPEVEPGDTVKDIYINRIWRAEGDLHVERLAHHFAWESYHSNENQANAYFPSRLFSEAFDLRAAAAGFDQTEPSGAPATRSYSAPPGFRGNLLYVRADLLHRYAANRAIITFGWGERRTQFVWPEKMPARQLSLYRAHQNIWRIIKQH
ncbi:hypothetical protein [Micromonospora chalcea]|uniref:hypothetical protein n=1 Tax=Micromonospora chalcea TaxID=1874 RepID=UPI0037ACC0F2